MKLSFAFTLPVLLFSASLLQCANSSDFTEDYCIGELSCASNTMCPDGETCYCKQGYAGDPKVACHNVSSSQPEGFDETAKQSCFIANINDEGYVCRCPQLSELGGETNCTVNEAFCTKCEDNANVCNIGNIQCWCERKYNENRTLIAMEAFANYQYTLNDKFEHGYCPRYQTENYTFEHTPLNDINAYSVEGCPAGTPNAFAPYYMATCGECGYFAKVTMLAYNETTEEYCNKITSSTAIAVTTISPELNAILQTILQRYDSNETHPCFVANKVPLDDFTVSYICKCPTPNTTCTAIEAVYATCYSCEVDTECNVQNIGCWCELDPVTSSNLNTSVIGEHTEGNVITGVYVVGGPSLQYTALANYNYTEEDKFVHGRCAGTTHQLQANFPSTLLRQTASSIERCPNYTENANEPYYTAYCGDCGYFENIQEAFNSSLLTREGYCGQNVSETSTTTTAVSTPISTIHTATTTAVSTTQTLPDITSTTTKTPTIASILNEYNPNTELPCFIANVPGDNSYICNCTSGRDLCKVNQTTCYSCRDVMCNVKNIGCWCEETSIAFAPITYTAYANYTYTSKDALIYGECVGQTIAGHTFPSTKLLQKAYSEERCPNTSNNANSPLATAVCNECGKFQNFNYLYDHETEFVKDYCDQTIEDLYNVVVSDNIGKVELENVLVQIDSSSSNKNITTNDIDLIISAFEHITGQENEITQRSFGSIVQITSTVMDSENLNNVDTANRYLDNLDKSSALVEIEPDGVIKVSFDNLSVIVANPSRVVGIGISADREQSKVDSELIYQEPSTTTNTNDFTASIYIRNSSFSVASRVSFYTFSNENFFIRTNADGRIVNSVIVGATIHGETPDELDIRSVYNPTQDYGRLNGDLASCNFWTQGAVGSSSSWSSEGCYIDNTKPIGLYIPCKCNHLTSFATLFDTGGYTDTVGSINIISTIGSIISAVTLVILIVYYSLTRCTYSAKSFSASFLLIQLGINLLLLNITLAITEIKAVRDDLMNNTAACQAIAILLHLFVLSSFSVMCCEAIFMYFQIVKPMLGLKHVTHSRVMKVSIVLGQVVPAILVAILAGTGTERFYKRDISVLGEPLEACWVARLEIKNIVIAPTAIIFSFNVIIFVLILFTLFFRKKPDGTSQKNYGVTPKNVLILIIIMITLGLTWCLGFFISGSFPRHASIVMAGIFAVTNSLQGFFIFIAYAMRRKDFTKWILCGSSASSFFASKATKSKNVSSTSKETEKALNHIVKIKQEN